MLSTINSSDKLNITADSKFSYFIEINNPVNGAQTNQSPTTSIISLIDISALPQLAGAVTEATTP